MEWLALLMAFIAGGLAATIAMVAVGWRGDTPDEAEPQVIQPPAPRQVVELHVKDM